RAARAAAPVHAAAWRARFFAARPLSSLRAGPRHPPGVRGNQARRRSPARPLRADRAGLMRALLAALLTAATLPVLPAADASKLVADVAGKPARPVVLHFWATSCEAWRDEFPSVRRELLAVAGRGV